MLTTDGHNPKLQIMDNEACDILNNTLLKKNVPYQLVPPHIHRRNAAKRSIQTFKDHCIAGLWSTDPKYPSQEWDRLILQATMTLNMLRTSHTIPELSAYAAIFGIHDFNRLPLAPPGTKVIVHEKADNH